jgi:hypothetical protein
VKSGSPARAGGARPARAGLFLFFGILQPLPCGRSWFSVFQVRFYFTISLEKKVKWFKEKIDRYTLSVPLQNTLRLSLNCFRVFFNSSILDNDISQISFFKEFLVDRPQWLMRRK